MRWLVNYIRQVFCKHDWEKSEVWFKQTDDMGGCRQGEKISLYCKKCGYHKSFWKF